MVWGMSALHMYHGRKLVGDRTAKSRLDVVRVTESQFADVVAIAICWIQR